MGDDGKALSPGSCVLYSLSRLPKTAVQERRSCRIRRNQREREAFLFFFFPLSETNLKHLFWRRLLLSFSFKVLTKKGDGINSSWLSSGNPGLLWDGGTGKIKERQKKMKTQPSQLNDGAGIIGEPAAR